jgi:hypothetical protein
LSQVFIRGASPSFQVKSFEVCDLPVRAAKFVARKNWVVTGSDDMQVTGVDFKNPFRTEFSAETS